MLPYLLILLLLLVDIKSDNNNNGCDAFVHHHHKAALVAISTRQKNHRQSSHIPPSQTISQMMRSFTKETEWMIQRQPPRGRVVVADNNIVMMHASSSNTAGSKNDGIAYQSDETQYGRGEYHLSADINEGQVVVYQIGTWYVDGVEVGDGNPPDWKLARIETIQVVWTHNCEHGVLRGYPVKLLQQQQQQQQVDDDDEDDGNNNTILVYDNDNNNDDDYDGDDPGEAVEFGPEQLVARLPVVWDDTVSKGFSDIKLDPSMWRQED